MAHFIACKDNGVCRLAFELAPSFSFNVNEKVNKNNYPVRVVNNKYGKIIVGCKSNRLYTQIVMANTNLFNKNEHIDFNYLTNEYFPKISGLLSNSGFFKEPDTYSIVVIVEGKMYEIYESGYVKEGEWLEFTYDVCSTFYPLYELEKNHDEKFLLDVFNKMEKVEIDNINTVMYIDDKDFRYRLLKK